MCVTVVCADGVIYKICLSRTEVFCDTSEFAGQRTLLTDQVLLCGLYYSTVCLNFLFYFYLCFCPVMF